MKKIPSLFKRDYEGTRLVYNEVVEGCDWVLVGEGRPTIKWDGTAVMIKDNKLFKRYEVKRGKTPPEDFVPADEVNEVTGKWVGWRPVGDGPEDKYHREGYDNLEQKKDGTYELVGPKIQSNPERMDKHYLVGHGKLELPHFPALPTFESIKEYLQEQDIEGIVWHHPDGRMCKIKKRDFGIKR